MQGIMVRNTLKYLMGGTMKDFLLKTIVLCLAGRICFAAWESMGPYGTAISAIARSGSDESILYASSRSNPTRIFKSTDDGITWNQPGEVAYYVHSLGVDPWDADIVYASGDGVVYKSSDGGVNWTSSAVSGIMLSGLTIHPTNSSTLYTVGMTTGSQLSMGFFRSTNSGQSWMATPLNSSTGQAHCLALDPLNPDILYVGGDYYDGQNHTSVYRSTDGGQTFSETSVGFDTSCVTVYSLAVHSTKPTVILAGTRYGGIYQSTDSGTSWHLVSSSDYDNILSLATVESTPDVFYAGADTTIYVSTNAGNSWFSSGLGLGGLSFGALSICPGQPTTVVTANNSGIYSSTDAGTSWFRTNTGMPPMSISNFFVAPISPSVIYAESRVGVFKTTTSNTPWVLLPHFLSCGNICGLTTHNMSPDIILALEGSG